MSGDPTRVAITDAHLQALERPPADVWARMPWPAQKRWQKRHQAALRARPAPEPEPIPDDWPLVDRVVAYLEAVTSRPRRLSIVQAARDLGVTRDVLRHHLTRAGRQDLLDQLRATRRGAS
jgi:hypothetical protein